MRRVEGTAKPSLPEPPRGRERNPTRVARGALQDWIDLGVKEAAQRDVGRAPQDERSSVRDEQVLVSKPRKANVESWHAAASADGFQTKVHRGSGSMRGRASATSAAMH